VAWAPHTGLAAPILASAGEDGKVRREGGNESVRSQWFLCRRKWRSRGGGSDKSSHPSLPPSLPSSRCSSGRKPLGPAAGARRRWPCSSSRAARLRLSGGLAGKEGGRGGREGGRGRSLQIFINPRLFCKGVNGESSPTYPPLPPSLPPSLPQVPDWQRAGRFFG